MNRSTCRAVRLLSVTVCAAGLVLATARPSRAAATDSWDFAGPASGTEVPDGTVFLDSTGAFDLNASDDAGGTTLLETDLDGTAHQSSVYFAGWQDADGLAIDDDAAMLSSDAGFENEPGGGLDAANDFDPGAEVFDVSIWMRPDDPAEFAPGVRSFSPNIVQKGNDGARGGFWKMSLQASLVNGQAVFQPFCMFGSDRRRTANPITLKIGYGPAERFVMVTGEAYQVECVKNGASFTRNVFDTTGTLVATRTETAARDFTIDNPRSLTVGKKPGSTDARDAYAGVLDDLVITKG